MFETLDRMMLAGLGALSMTREKAEQMFDEYVSRGRVERDARTGFVRDVMDSAERTRRELERLVSEQVQQTMRNLHVATQEDVQRVEREMAGKVDLLRVEQKVDQLLAKEP